MLLRFTYFLQAERLPIDLVANVTCPSDHPSQNYRKVERADQARSESVTWIGISGFHCRSLVLWRLVFLIKDLKLNWSGIQRKEFKRDERVYGW